VGVLYIFQGSLMNFKNLFSVNCNNITREFLETLITSTFLGLHLFSNEFFLRFTTPYCKWYLIFPSILYIRECNLLVEGNRQKFVLEKNM